MFAAGIVLWEALASRHLFRRDDDLKTVLTVREARVPDIRRFAPGIDDRVVAALHRALQADPEKRHPTAQAFADEIAAWLRDQPLRAGARLVSSVVRDVLDAERPRPSSAEPKTHGSGDAQPPPAQPRLATPVETSGEKVRRASPPPLPRRRDSGDPVLLIRRRRRVSIKSRVG